MPQMTRLRMGSGGSALSLGFAAAFGVAGGFGPPTVPALATGGAGVLPSTGSAIFPLLDLSISIINRDYRQTKFQETVFRYNFLYFRNPLPVKANSDFWSYLCTRLGLRRECASLLRGQCLACRYSPSRYYGKRFQHRGH